MSLSITVLNPEEQFLKFIDPDLCTLTDSIEKDGLRTLEMEYKFQDYQEDKELFKLGNKIAILGDTNLTDCLYVINTDVTRDIYQENSFKFEIEEVLVELNNAPLFLQTELTTGNGFDLSTNMNDIVVKVDWNALNYWFGNYFNIGVVQNCISQYSSKISITGSINLMELLRFIESETSNVFVTRYEKDVNNNVIHRYLDFLNPINVNKDWEFNIQYDIKQNVYTGVTDSNDNIISDSTEDVYETDDIVEFPKYTPPTNLNPADLVFRFTDGEKVLTNTNNVPLQKSSTDIGFTNETTSANIQITHIQHSIGLIVNNRSFVIGAESRTSSKTTGFVSVANDPTMINDVFLPDDSYFEIYDTANSKVVFRTKLNYNIGTVHEEILDFEFNVENVSINIDESETYIGISPVLSFTNESLSANSINRDDMTNIINDWLNLSISKGDIIPLVIEKFNISAESLNQAITNLGTFKVDGNYYTRPIKPNDNEGSTYEFYRATKYWQSPFNKNSGEFHVLHEKNNNIEYNSIYSRPDNDTDAGKFLNPKLGTVESSKEDPYAIFYDVAMKLQDVCTPTVDIDVDVANLRNGQFNQYELHDKVYIKLPDSQEVVTARVTRTEKEAHDIAKNTVKLSNYSVNTVQTVPQEVYITGNNTSFHYPSSSNINVKLINAEYDSEDEYKNIQYPANKLLTFTLYRIEDGQNTMTGDIYTKRTDAYGEINLPVAYDPGDYKMEVYFAGDEEYTEASLILDLNVYGVKEEPQTVSASTNAKVTKKANKSKSKVQKYYDKYGRSPNKKKILAIGKRSTSTDGGTDTKVYEKEFRNKCPHCGKQSLIWSINWITKNSKGKKVNKFPVTGKSMNYNDKGLICCSNSKCGAIYSVLGNDHDHTNPKPLTVTTKSKKSDLTRANTLKKGKMPYGAIIKTTTKKKVTTSTSTQRNNVSNGINKAVKEQALKIVGNSTGLAAAKKIAKWCGDHIGGEDINNFYQSPATTLKRRKGNCCCQTWLMLVMMDAVGCREKLTMKYVHIHGSGGGHVFAQLITKKTGTKRYVDPRHSPYWGACLHGGKWGNLPGTTKEYTGPNSKAF